VCYNSKMFTVCKPKLDDKGSVDVLTQKGETSGIRKCRWDPVESNLV
jgi:hypothetical protein